MTHVVSTDYPFLDVNWQPRSFGLLAFRWDHVTDYAAGLSIRGSNLTTRIPLLSVPGSLFYKMSSSSKAQAGGLCTARFELSPLRSTATVATRGHRFGANAEGRLGFVALDTPPILVSVFDSVSRRGFSSHIACIHCQTFVYRQPSDRRPGVLPTTPYV